MTRYLVDCELEELELEIPREHAQDLAAYFDGRHEGERGAAQAQLEPHELRLEAEGGRLALVLEGRTWRARDLELMGDRNGEFFESVVVNLLRAYRGRLIGRVRWSASGAGQGAAWLDVRVEDGRSTWPSGAVGKWMSGRPRQHLAEEAESASDSLEEVFAKLEEAERHFAEYLRLKQQRSVAK